jgi:hypothetical protein
MSGAGRGLLIRNMICAQFEHACCRRCCCCCCCRHEDLAARLGELAKQLGLNTNRTAGLVCRRPGAWCQLIVATAVPDDPLAAALAAAAAVLQQLLLQKHQPKQPPAQGSAAAGTNRTAGLVCRRPGTYAVPPAVPGNPLAAALAAAGAVLQPAAAAIDLSTRRHRVQQRQERRVLNARQLRAHTGLGSSSAHVLIFDVTSGSKGFSPTTIHYCFTFLHIISVLMFCCSLPFCICRPVGGAARPHLHP